MDSLILDPKYSLSQVNEQIPGTVRFSEIGCASSLLSLTSSFLIFFDWLEDFLACSFDVNNRGHLSWEGEEDDIQLLHFLGGGGLSLSWLTSGVKMEMGQSSFCFLSTPMYSFFFFCWCSKKEDETSISDRCRVIYKPFFIPQQVLGAKGFPGSTSLPR